MESFGYCDEILYTYHTPPRIHEGRDGKPSKPSWGTLLTATTKKIRNFEVWAAIFVRVNLGFDRTSQSHMNLDRRPQKISVRQSAGHEHE